MSRSAVIRARAARVVSKVAIEGRSLDATLAEDAGGTPQERGLLRSLSYESIRWYMRLDALLRRLLARPNQALEPEVHALAIVGLAQLIYTDIPPHAAVAETVDAARVLKQPRAAGLLNAILRRWQREGAKLAAQVDREVAARTSHPDWLVKSLTSDWKDRAPAMLAANNEKPPFWLRVNRLRVAGSDYRKQLEGAGHEIAASLFDDEALQLVRPVDVHELPGFAEGLVSVQDAAAQVAARLLAPQPGERILDACAAPGGKTCHLLELQPQLEQLVAVDVSEARLKRVTENLQRLRLAATVMTADAADPATWWDGKLFDRILLDVPCSATGVIRRHVDIKVLRRADDIPVLVERQKALLERTWQMLRPGGWLLYASCSVLSAETRGVVADFLYRTPGAMDVTAGRLQFFAQPMLAELNGPGPGLAIVTGTAGMDGFYYACLQKREG